MLSPQAIIKGIVSRLLPSLTLDGPEAERALRMGRYGDAKVESAWPTDHLLADEGTYMVASMAPGATALQLGLSSAFAAAAAAFVLQNSDSPGPQAKRLYPKFLRLAQNIAPNAGTALRYALVLDNVSRIPTTLSSPAGTLQGPGTPATATAYRAPVVCTNSDVTPVIVGIPYFPLSTAAGAVPAIPAASPFARTIVGNGIIKPSIPVVLDQYMLQFGGTDISGTFQAAASLAKLVECAPAIVVGPGQFLVIYLWSPGNVATAGNAFDDAALGWIEK
jgi:hypothetical protein